MTSSKINKDGFSLIEVSIALLVASIGLMATFGLFPTGLQANKDSIDDTQLGLFAQDVLNGYLAYSAVDPWDTWSSSRELQPVAANLWANPKELIIRPNTDGMNAYKSTYDESITDFAVRYRLSIEDVPNASTVNGQGLSKFLLLETSNGEFGPKDEYDNVFYTEVWYTGIP